MLAVWRHRARGRGVHHAGGALQRLPHGAGLDGDAGERNHRAARFAVGTDVGIRATTRNFLGRTTAWRATSRVAAGVAGALWWLRRCRARAVRWTSTSRCEASPAGLQGPERDRDSSGAGTYEPGSYEVIVGRRLAERVAASRSVSRSAPEPRVAGRRRLQRGRQQLRERAVGRSRRDGGGLQPGRRLPVADGADERPGRHRGVGEAIETNPRMQLQLKQERQYDDEQAGPVGGALLVLAVFVASLWASAPSSAR